MNKTLLTATLATAFSGIVFATETPQINHIEELTKLVDQCDNNPAAKMCPKMAKACPKLKAMLDDVTERLEKTGVPGFLEEEKSKIENYVAAAYHKPKLENILPAELPNLSHIINSVSTQENQE